MGFFSKINEGLHRSRTRLKEQMNVLLDRGPDVNDDFWDDLEETLILADIGASAADNIIEELRDQAKRKALPDAYAVFDMLTDQMAATFTEAETDIFDENPSLVLFVGINGAGKTTTVGKLAAAYHEQGRKVLLGSADTFRAAAIEQLDVWGQRAGVPVIKRDRGSDPASVCYDVLDEADKRGSDLVLIDTAGRLHTSPELMRELAKVVNVTRKRAANMAAGPMPVSVVLVIDAATGQNGLNQALEFNEALGLDGIIMTKLDGTAKGGIAMAVAEKLKLPILRVGVGEQVDDLQEFNAKDFCRALVGESN